jgi:radical SAM superfamily enzyme YgiQ (UPF0313 family)
MNILLVNPEGPATFWSFKNALKFTSKKAAFPPLGLLTVAAMLPDDWSKRVIDMAVSPLRDRDIEWADYVFISAMYIQKASVKQIVDRCRKLGRKTVAGGPLFNVAPRDYDDIDHLILNEAELTLEPFLDDLQHGCAKHIYKSDQWADMTETPAPDWSGLPMKRYAAMSVQYSRGCPFECDFCNVTTLFGRKIRTKTPDQILLELDSLYHAGWRGQVFFVDDNFIGNAPKLKRNLLPRMIEWSQRRRFPFTFNTQASINLADDPELMSLMTQAGFNCVFVGIESPSEESLAECSKRQNRGRDLIACVKEIQSSGMQVQAGFIVGFDSDQESIFDNLIRFIQQSGIVTAMVGLLNAPMGTSLYRRLHGEERLLPKVSGDNTDFSMNFIPRMESGELLAGYRKVVTTIYAPRPYYERVRTFLQDYKPVVKSHGRARYSDLKAFFTSLWRLGIVDRGRRYYWKLLFWGLRHPRNLHLAITMAIYGFHFRRVFGVDGIA